MKKIVLILAAAMAVMSCSEKPTEVEEPFSIVDTFWFNDTNSGYIGTGLGFYEGNEALIMWITSPSRYMVGIYDYVYHADRKEFFLYGKKGYVYVDGYTEDIADRGYSLNDAGGTIDLSSMTLDLYMNYDEPDENFFGVFEYTEDDLSDDLPKSGNIPVRMSDDIFDTFSDVLSYE